MSTARRARSERTGPEALVVGEALVDEVVDGPRTVSRPGGSPFNVAVGLARLGLPTLLHTALGNDERGALLRDHALQSGVALTAESLTRDPTSSARAVIGADGAAAYDFAVEWRPRTFWLPTVPRVVHAGSIAACLPPGRDLVAGVLSALRPTSIVSLDPNVRPQLISDPESARRRLLELIALADVVKVSDEDLAWIHPDRRIEDVASNWLTHAPDLVVVTRGAAGATAYSGWGEHRSLPPECPVVDSIGAGDAFMAGLLCSLLDEGATARGERLASLGRSGIDRALDIAARCAAVAVGRPGADPPWRRELLP